MANATVTADNAADTARRYAISAELHIAHGSLERITAGMAVGTGTDRAHLADFGLNSDGSLWLTLADPAADSAAVLGAIIAFAAAAREKVAADAPVRV